MSNIEEKYQQNTYDMSSPDHPGHHPSRRSYRNWSHGWYHKLGIQFVVNNFIIVIYSIFHLMINYLIFEIILLFSLGRCVKMIYSKVAILNLYLIEVVIVLNAFALSFLYFISNFDLEEVSKEEVKDKSHLTVSELHQAYWEGLDLKFSLVPNVFFAAIFQLETCSEKNKAIEPQPPTVWVHTPVKAVLRVPQAISKMEQTIARIESEIKAGNVVDKIAAITDSPVELNPSPIKKLDDTPSFESEEPPVIFSKQTSRRSRMNEVKHGDQESDDTSLSSKQSLGRGYSFRKMFSKRSR